MSRVKFYALGGAIWMIPIISNALGHAVFYHGASWWLLVPAMVLASTFWACLDWYGSSKPRPSQHTGESV